MENQADNIDHLFFSISDLQINLPVYIPTIDKIQEEIDDCINMIIKCERHYIAGSDDWSIDAIYKYNIIHLVTLYKKLYNHETIL